MVSPSERPIPTIDGRLNVAQLLKLPVGAWRKYHVMIPALPIGEERIARDMEGIIKLTRAGRGILVAGDLTTHVELTCMRCLEEYQQPVELSLEDEFRPAIDVTSGVHLSYPEEDAEPDAFRIGDDHVLDITEALRQATWLGIPMVPRCLDDCAPPAIDLDADEEQDEVEPTPAADANVDARFAVLQRLMGETSPGGPAANSSPADRRRGTSPGPRS
jgi:uncharacterized protein